MNKLAKGLLIAGVVVVLFAWYDGGREPQRMIEQPVTLPVTAQ